MSKSMRIRDCILCGDPVSKPFLDLGKIPLPNRLPELNSKPDVRYPLAVCVCKTCGHVQLNRAVPPERMFLDYTYVPSTSAFLTRHFKQMAADVMDITKAKTPFVVDIGGNDGLLLSFFRDDFNATVLNIDPAVNLKQASEARGVPMSPVFFNLETAESVKAIYGEADIITATNCLAHTANLASYLKGVETLLSPTGTFVVEAPYLWSLIDDLRYDTIYHEHQSYFAVAPLHDSLFMYGLRLDGAHFMPDVHGGSMRYFIRKINAPRLRSHRQLISPKHWIDTEEDRGELMPQLEKFGAEVRKKRDEIRSWFAEKARSGAVIAGIGASAKAAITLNYCEITPEQCQFVADANPLKQGRAIPGVRIPILPEEALAAGNVDIVVNFIWNLRSDVEEKLKLLCGDNQPEIVEF